MHTEDAVFKSVGGSPKSITPAVEFRRWLTLASVFAILAGCIAPLLSRLLTWDSLVKIDIVIALYCLVVSFGEGWIQFDTAGRRVLWSFAGPSVVVVALLTPRAWTGLAFLVPASIEFFAALGKRKRPWIWLIATPLLIVSSDEFWGGPLSRGARYMVELVSNWFNMVPAVPTETPQVAATFGVYLIARAAIGSFIASRKVT